MATSDIRKGFWRVVIAVLLTSAWACSCVTVRASPNDTTTLAPESEKEKQERDHEALKHSLTLSGGLPGEVPATIVPVQNPKPTDPSFWDKRLDDPCTDWAYEFTNVFPEGVARHEHAVIRYQGTDHEVLDIAGIYAKNAGRNGKSFVIDYFKQNDSRIRVYEFDINCKGQEWGVLTCWPCLKTDFVFHEHQEPSCREAGAVPLTVVGQTTLEDMVGVSGLPKYEVPKSFNSLKLLEYFGGLPGQVQFHKNQSEPPPEPSDPSQRPLPDAPRESWLYNHWEYWLPFAIRTEHATVRFAGKRNEFLDVRGVLYWRSNVGDFRIEYRQDDTGFNSSVDATDCDITRGLWRCEYPKGFSTSCGAAIPSGLLASLVG